MARLIIPKAEDIFEEMSIIASYYESEFEAKFKQHVQVVFQDYYVLTFKDIINSSNRRPKRPDLLLIKHDFTDWWIVEVELIGHQLTEVMEQVRVFVSPDLNHLLFGRKMKTKFDEEYADLNIDLVLLQNMVLNIAPKVLVVVDEYKSKWATTISNAGAKLCIFQVFKNTKSEEAYRIAGDYPMTLRQITHCSAYEKNSPNSYKIIEPEQLDIQVGSTIEIFYNDRSHSFDVVLLGENTVIKFNGKFNSIPTKQTYILHKDNNNRLILKTN